MSVPVLSAGYACVCLTLVSRSALRWAASLKCCQMPIYISGQTSLAGEHLVSFPARPMRCSEVSRVRVCAVSFHDVKAAGARSDRSDEEATFWVLSAVIRERFKFFKTVLIAEIRAANTGQHTNARQAGGKRDKMRRFHQVELQWERAARPGTRMQQALIAVS